jgi:hypothetical protein
VNVHVFTSEKIMTRQDNPSDVGAGAPVGDPTVVTRQPRAGDDLPGRTGQRSVGGGKLDTRPGGVSTAHGATTVESTVAGGALMGALPVTETDARVADATARSKPSPEVIQDVKDVLMQAMADTLDLAKATLNDFADYYAPRIAQQAILAASPDPEVATVAKRNIRHLRAQATMDAGRFGVALQQRHELALGAIIQTIVAAGIASL